MSENITGGGDATTEEHVDTYGEGRKMRVGGDVTNFDDDACVCNDAGDQVTQL